MNEFRAGFSEVRSPYAWLVGSICLWALSGCIVKHESPAIKLEKAFIVGPEKTYPMELGIDADQSLSKDSSVTPYVTVVGKTSSFRTRFSALPDRSGFSVASSSGKMDIEVDEEGIVYQMNGGEEVALDVRTRKSSFNPKYPDSYYVYVDFKLVEPLSNYTIYMPGGDLISSTVDKIEQGENNLHRFYFPFIIDGEEYAADISFRVKIRWELDVDVPVTP